ncbi:HNH endonuclease signature motif containing protein [Streptomyces sp. NPDC058463]|uniref:HNH endonuclease signature motif containing protein n=1 Tax=Streptomyces sp. NPDC058463 TaxID=3346510 RepID=UPI0036682C83
MSQGKQYTREQLIKAAEHCSDIDEVIAFFGTHTYGHLRRYLLRRFAHFGIDVSHFSHRGSDTVASRPTRRTLCEAVANSRSLAELLRKLGRRDNGHQRNLLHQWIAEEGITTSHFLGQAHQRGKPATTPTRRPQDLLVKHDGKRRTKTVLLRRALSEIGVPERCGGCGSDPVWRGNPVTLEIDHINGDWSDDRAENLRLLCPNCHAITNTWCRGGVRRTVHPPRLANHLNGLPGTMTGG